MEHALLYTFLEASSDCRFKDQLHSLKSLGPGAQPSGRRRHSLKGLGPGVQPSGRWRTDFQGPSDDDLELQCDGNRSGHLQNGELGAGAPVNEDVVRIIAAQLAEIGDQLDKEIQARVVNDLVQHFLNENLSIEEITVHMSRVVRELAQAIPSDMEQEKAMLVLAMLLTKKIVNTVPSLLHRAFDITVDFMNQQLHNYVVEMLGE